ncbi:MAG: hypothetical protein QOF53_1912 [Nocardioidaceae bacterium]|jgi:uncharacterized membrane protein (TIGR02234 family)|nr:hypothetical protein [Nocardioidaceae bacterium]
MAERARSFGPTVLAGLGGATLGAVAASRDWARASGSAAGVHVAAAVQGSSSAPLAVALALVALAAWGVVLVLRGRARRAVAILGALAAAGTALATAIAYHRAQDDAVRAVVARGGTGDSFTTSLTGWYYVCLAAAVLTLLGFAVAVAESPRWPAMGSRYDAPAARPTREDAAGPGEPSPPAAEQDMWGALDDGRDPTA